MSVVKDSGPLGPAPDTHQVGLLSAYVVNGVPFMMIRAGKSKEGEITAVQKARAEYGVGPDVLCFRVPELDNFIAESLDDECPGLLSDGEAVLFRPEKPFESKSIIENLHLFFDELTSSEMETVLLPQIATPLANFLNDGIDWSAASEDDKANWERIRSLRDTLDCTKQLLDCVDYVREIGYPMLLWHFPEHDWTSGRRLIAHKVEHWIVPSFLVAAL
jgi:hypothetical protein